MKRAQTVSEKNSGLVDKGDINADTSTSFDVPYGGCGWFIVLAFVLYNFFT